MDVSSPSVDTVYNALLQGASNRSAVSSSAMNLGAQHLQQQDYGQAVQDFMRAIAYGPDQPDAYRLLGRTYALMGRSTDAEKAYQQALQVDPSYAEVRGDLANLYLSAGRYGDAEAQYQKVLQANPADSGAASALGFVYLQTGRLAEADTQLVNAARLDPNNSKSYYQLGLLREKQGRSDEAVALFQRAISIQHNDARSISELGYTYLQMGRTDDAQQQVQQLELLGTDESNGYAAQLDLAMLTPQMSYVDLSKSTYNMRLGAGTTLDQLDPSLATPGASATLQMTFRFNQPMDMSSIQDIFNWSIREADGGTGGVYNNGVQLDRNRQVAPLPFPTSVKYDPLEQTATVYFRVSQNAAGDGLMDPRHWVFQFRGTDAGGHAMDPIADEFDWATGLPF